MVKRAAFIVALAAICACKERGTETLVISVPQTCQAAPELRVWFAKGVGCNGCSCDSCAVCTIGACKNTCDGCTPADLADGLPLVTPGPGTYAVVVELVDAGHVTARACVDQVEIDADGTMSRTITLDAACCSP